MTGRRPQGHAPYLRKQTFDASIVLAALTVPPPGPEAARASLEAAGFAVRLWVPAAPARCLRAIWEIQTWVDEGDGAGDTLHLWLEGPGADLRAAELVDVPEDLAETFRGSAVLGVSGRGGARGLAFYDRMLRVARALAPQARLLDITAGRVPPDAPPTTWEDAYGLHQSTAVGRAWVYTLGLRVFGLPEIERFVPEVDAPRAVAQVRRVAEAWLLGAPPAPGARIGGHGLAWQPWATVGPGVAAAGPGARAEDRERMGGASVVLVEVEGPPGLPTATASMPRGPAPVVAPEARTDRPRTRAVVAGVLLGLVVVTGWVWWGWATDAS